MRSILILAIATGLMSATVAQAQQSGDAISDGLAALLGRAQQGGQTPTTQGAADSVRGLVDATSANAVASLMQQAGYRAVVGVDNYGDPTIESSTAGVDFTVYFFGCQNGANCQSLQFLQGFDLPKGTSYQMMNDWNATKRFGFAFLDDESDPFVTMDVNMAYGVSEDNLLDTLRLWDQVLSDFQAHINW